MQPEFLMQRQHRSLHGAGFHNQRDVVLGGALRDGDDVDPLTSQRRERASSNSWYSSSDISACGL